MQKFPLKLEKSLELRKQINAFRELGHESGLIDLCSNDYLGFAGNTGVYTMTHEILVKCGLLGNGASGSRLLSGNHRLYPLAEEALCRFFNSESALIYNSGYDANLGFFSSVPQRQDVILFDELSHASIRDGISLGRARGIKFPHNDLEALGNKLKKIKQKGFSGEIFIVTEAVFSMDGDLCDLRGLAELAEIFGCRLVIDEAHALGILGPGGEGLVCEQDLEDRVFARIVTFGKAFGAHGAAILGSTILRDYLVNFSRSLMYTTALPPHSVAAILVSLEHLQGSGRRELDGLQGRIRFFLSEMVKRELQSHFITSRSAIHSCIVPGNDRVKEVAAFLRKNMFNVKPILSPTVPKGEERLRFCLHSYNTDQELREVLSLLEEVKLKFG